MPTISPVDNAPTPSRTTLSRAASMLLVATFTTTIFCASALLFILEPLFAKMVLPVLGGSPAVWNTCMVFFQSALLLAYVYSHVLGRWPATRSVVLHCLALLLPVLVLPVAMPAHLSLATIAAHPAASVLLMCVGGIGLPFFFVATTAPLLQRWFSGTAHPNAGDPYFLYAASNAGSLIGLALFPALLEPLLPTGMQGRIWSIAYAVFVVLTATCGLVALRWRVPLSQPVADAAHGRTTWRDRILWAGLAFVPASLLYGVTAQLSTDFPPIPLLWVVPLAIYLATFIVGFSTRLSRVRQAARVVPLVIVAAMLLFLAGDSSLLWAPLGIVKLLCFAVIALALHGELAHRRPAVGGLTEYYLWISAGGVLGGVLNSLVAPAVFNDIWEYPITLLLAAAFLPVIAVVRRRPSYDRPAVIGLAVVCVGGLVLRFVTGPPSIRALLLALAVIVCVRIPLRWTAFSLLIIALSLGRDTRARANTVYQGRSFFGTYRVSLETQNGKRMVRLIHGTTVHGTEYLDDTFLRQNPQGYYGVTRPVVDLLRQNGPVNVGVVGLGAGMVARYVGVQDSITFFEIDPLVERIARDPRSFSFLHDCTAQNRVVLGDGRLTIRDAAPNSFDLLMLDAFSSDAPPLHLLTREAFGMYRQKLKPAAIILLQISNNYLDLAPVVAGSSSSPGHSVLLMEDLDLSHADIERGRMASRWAAIVPVEREQQLIGLGWKPFSRKPMVWTDDHSSIFSAVMWRRLFVLSASHTGGK